MRQRAQLAVFLVVPDHDCHSFWIDRRVSGYFVADEAVRAILIARGIEADRIFVTGVPIDASFAQHRDRATARAALGLTDAPVVLLIGGAIGAPATKLAFHRLRRIDVQLVVVCGRNAALHRELIPFDGGQVRVLGFRDDIHDLMDAVDVLVSKAGAVTVAEALAKGLPAVCFWPIPRQEERNARYVVEGGAGALARTANELEREVIGIVADPSRRAELSWRALALARPDAAYAVLRELTDGSGWST